MHIQGHSHPLLQAIKLPQQAHRATQAWRLQTLSPNSKHHARRQAAWVVLE